MTNNLQHHGIKGQRWGVRRFQDKDGSLTAAGKKRYGIENSIAGTKVYTKKGVEVRLESQPTHLITKVAAKLSKSARDNLNKSDFVDITVNGERVGDLQLYQEKPKSVNVVWVSVDPKHEGNGYGKTVMQAVKDHAKKSGMEQVTLEVPGISPNARHIYESLGFKAVGKISSDDDSWGGLTAMVLDLKDK